MRFRSIVLVVVLALAAGACSSSGDDDTTAGSTDAQDTLRPLRVGLPADTANVDGDKANLAMGNPNANIYERLVRMDENFQIHPWLAESWELVPPNTWRFHLRTDVTFHDGTPLTAADVAWTYDRIARAGGRAINAAEGGTKVIDDHTVDFTPSKPNLKIPLQVVHPIFGIMKAGSDPVKAPVGTGPFTFVSYTPKESLSVTRFDGYWDEANAAKTSGVTWRFIPDPAARVLALEAGDVDVIADVPRESVASLTSKGYPIVRSEVGAYEALSMQIHGPAEFDLTNDVTIRKAVAMAINRTAIVDQVLEGNAEPGRNLVPPAILGAAQGQVKGGPAFDLAGAQKLLDDAGWAAGGDGIRVKDGRRLELTLINGFPSADIHRPIPEVIQSDLAKAGIAVRIEEVADYDATLASQAGNLWIERGNQNDANPAFLPNLLYTSIESGNAAGVDYARAFAPGAGVDTPMAAAQATEDVAKTQQLAAEAMKVLIDDNVVILPLAGIYNISATSKKVSGFTVHSAQIHTEYASVSVAA